MSIKLRIWFWIYCKLGIIYANVYRRSFLKDENKLRGKSISVLAEYIHRKKVAPLIPKRTSEERWAIILGEKDNEY